MRTTEGGRSRKNKNRASTQRIFLSQTGKNIPKNYIFNPKPWAYDQQYWNKTARTKHISNMNQINIDAIDKKKRLKSPFDSINSQMICSHPHTHELSIDKAILARRKVPTYWDFIKSNNSRYTYLALIFVPFLIIAI